MRKSFVAIAATAALAGCGQGGDAAGGANHAAPSLPPFDVSTATPIGLADACYLAASDVATALGVADEPGAPLDIAPEMRTCVYGKGLSQMRVNITEIAPEKVDEFRKRVIEGTLDYLAGDADNAAYHVAKDGSTCALTFMRANLNYDLRLTNCKDIENAKDKLLSLPRPQ